MMKKIKYSKSELLMRIHLEFPNLKFFKAKVNNKGWDHTIIILDNKYVFRFPKNKSYIKKIRTEMLFLNSLRDMPIKVPNYLFISKDKSFGGYQLISGKELTKTRFQKLNNKQKKVIANQLGRFLTSLHNFPINTAKEIGLKYEWSLEEEKKEYNKRKKAIFSALNYKEKKFVKNFVKHYFSMKVPSKLCVIHHDFSDNHILIHKEKVNGVIDFGDSSLGDPAKDFSCLWNLGDDFVLNVYKTYKGKKDSKFLQRSRYYNYTGYLNQLYHGVVDNKKRMLKNALKKTKEIMRITLF